MFSKKDEVIEISRERDVEDVEIEVPETESISIIGRDTDILSLWSISDWTVAYDPNKKRHQKEQERIVPKR